ncbi:YkgJ family cysteine cluster protein [Kaarinaea lacus]
MGSKKDSKKDKNKEKKVEVKPNLEGIEITLENKCSFCEGSKCCNHISMEIDTPETMKDFDQLLWKISHQQIEIYKDEGSWHLMVVNVPCANLLPDGACGIYEKRPMICREYSNEYCEFDSSAEDDFDLHFRDYESLEKYCRKRFTKWDRRFKKWLKDD